MSIKWPVSNPFKHQPLDLDKTQIRLFRLIPAESDEILAGIITIHDFEHCPQYKAVSYTWGPPDQTREISLGGQSFTVRENLWQFLNAVRYHGETWLWIDQICIDQTAVDERNHQVSLMAKIYAKAREVLIWLGTEAHGSGEAMEAINSGYYSVRNHALQVKALFRRPYWSRLWILQEVLMSQDASVLCGNKIFSWKRLEALFIPQVSGADGLWTYPVYINEVALSLIKEKASFTGANQRLSYILETFAGLQCEDVRDKVYGLLSLVRTSGAMPVDYSKTSAEVFFNAIGRIISDESLMDFESHFDVGRHLRGKMMLVDINDLEIAIHVNQNMEDRFNQNKLLWAASKGQEALVNYLLDKGANLESKDEDGRTPLLLAAYNGHEAVVEQLLEKGANLESKDSSGRTPLLWAAFNGHGAVVKQLLEKGANLESKDEDSRMPLLYAAGRGHEVVVKQLLERGANLESKDWCGRTPLLLAAFNGREAVVKQLLEKGANLESKDVGNRTPLLLAARYGHETVVKQLLEKGANLESKDSSGQTPLSWAVFNGREAVVKQLLERGANLESKDWCGRTPLLLAAYYGHEAVVKQLLERGANLESKDEDSRMPLLYAAERGHEVVVKQLLEKGANLESKNRLGRTPLFCAVQNGHKVVVKQLLEKGGNPESKDILGRTPLMCAIENRNGAVARLLRRALGNPN